MRREPQGRPKRVTVDVKSTFAEIAHAQRGNEIGFNQFRAELRDLAGGMTQVATRTQELESAMEDWTEPDGLEAPLLTSFAELLC